MAKYSTSITFSKDNLTDDLTTRKIEYKYSVMSGNKLWTTTYNNIINNNELNESFNELTRDNNNNIFEKVGKSKNKNCWNIKEFCNSIENKKYKNDYNRYNFNDLLFNNINDGYTIMDFSDYSINKIIRDNDAILIKNI